MPPPPHHQLQISGSGVIKGAQTSDNSVAVMPHGIRPKGTYALTVKVDKLQKVGSLFDRPKV